MSTLTEKNYQGDLILFEEDKDFSRELVTIAAGANLTLGAVLGKITANGKYAHSAPGAVDGSEAPVAVLIEDAAAAAADVQAVALVRHARVRRSALNFEASIDTAGERDTAVDALNAIGIIAADA